MIFEIVQEIELKESTIDLLHKIYIDKSIEFSRKELKVIDKLISIGILRKHKTRYRATAIGKELIDKIINGENENG